MTKCTMLAAVLLAAVSPAALAQSAPAPAAGPVRRAAPMTLDELFKAARRGDVSALRLALDAAPNDEVRALIRARLAAAALDPQAGREPALARLAGGTNPALRRAALEVLAYSAFAEGDYAGAERHGRPLAELLAAAGMAEEAEAADRAWRLAALLAGRPAQRLAAPVAAGSTPARIDRVGLPRIDIAVNGTAIDAVFDTGANLTVLSAETARRMGVEVRSGETPIGNGVDTTVPARIGIAQRIEVAGNVVENVPVLIIDDAHLTFAQVPGGYDIKAILGMPVMRALGRVRMERAGRLVVLPPEGSGPSNMRASGNLLYVDAAVAGAAMPLLLDSGANQTQLSALYAEAHPDAVAALPRAQSAHAGAGGARSVSIATWANAPIALAGRTLRLPSLPVQLPAEGAHEPRGYGTLGSSVLLAFESWTLDFDAMRFELGEPVRTASAQ
jgi:predicted aspartyl protease